MPVDEIVNAYAIVALVKERDRQGYNLLYDRFSPLLFGVICKMVKDAAAAEDLLQESFIKVWKNIDQFDAGKASFTTWLVNIARYTTIDYLRSRGFKQQQKNQPVEKYEYQEVGYSETAVTETIGLRKMVGTLEPKYREIIDLIYFGGHTQEEVAGILDIPLGTVKTRARYALRILRNKM